MGRNNRPDPLARFFLFSLFSQTDHFFYRTPMTLHSLSLLAALAESCWSRYRQQRGEARRGKNGREGVSIEQRGYPRDLRDEGKFGLFHQSIEQTEKRGCLQSIFIIYLRVSSDWLLPDLCPMGRAKILALSRMAIVLHLPESVLSNPTFLVRRNTSTKFHSATRKKFTILRDARWNIRDIETIDETVTLFNSHNDPRVSSDLFREI